MTTLAIIGTAGRKSDKSRLTQRHYPRMVEAAYSLIQKLSPNPSDIKLVSGGAAWADHVAVTLVREGLASVSNLTVYLPAHLTSQGFVESPGSDVMVAKTANHYHHLFSECCGFDSLEQLREVGRDGAYIVPGDGGFHARNIMVARAASGREGHVLAFTFGSGNTDQVPWTIRSFGPYEMARECGLKNGGTAHCWSNCKCPKFHCLLGEDA